MYVKALNGVVERFPYSPTDLIRENPSTSFPGAMLSNDVLEEWGVFQVEATPQPQFNDRTHRIEQVEPEFVGGSWEQRWKVTALTAAEVAATEAAQAQGVREQRNQALKDTDWTQVADAPVDKAAWAAYRQALRDITAQQGFPWEVQWPEQPA